MKILYAILALILLNSPIALAQGVKVAAEIDSVETIQGKLRKIDISVNQAKDATLDWGINEQDNKNSLQEIYPGIEIRTLSAIDTIEAGDRLELRRSILVQPWDSGEFVIPGLILTAGLDTFQSNSIVLKVFPADTDTMTTINTKAYMPVVEQKAHFWDWVPNWLYSSWWIILLAIIIIGGGAFIAYVILSGKIGAKSLIAPKKVIPPYELAISRLNELNAKKLCEKGQEKQYYTTLTEILREYLDGRFGINAMEMTTPQIKRAVYATIPAKTASKLMGEILEMADYVKFARMRPLPEDNMRAFTQAMQFVESTKPEPQTLEKEDKQ